MFVVQISLLIVTFLSLISRICHQCKPPKKSTHTSSSYYYVTLLNVGACVRHIALEGQVEWTTLVQVTGERIQIILTSPLCYSILSHVALFL